MSKSIYSTSVTKCVLPHYKNDTGESGQFFSNWKMNSVFEQEHDRYVKKGHKMCSAISGLCEADLFSQFGLIQHDEYVQTLFSTMSCYKGKDTVVSFLEAGRPYKLLNSYSEQSCPDNVVFKKNCLIIPRGELLWALLAIPGDAISVSNDPNSFRIYIHSVKESDRIDAVSKADMEFDTHAKHLKIEKIEKITKTETQPPTPTSGSSTDEKKEPPATPQLPTGTPKQYVTLNPFLYTRIRAYRCIPPDGRTLDEQHFMVHKMNAFYTHSMGALALIPVSAKRLLQYPPATREQLCCTKDEINVGIPEEFYKSDEKVLSDGKKFLNWACYEGDNGIVYKYTGNLPRNTIVFPEAVSLDVCQSNRKDLHSFIQHYESSMMVKVREEYAEIKPEFKMLECYDEDEKAFWFKFIRNTYPTTLKFKEDIISQFTPNCMLTPLGVVALRDICEGDPLIFKENEMQIEKLNVKKHSSPWECSIETLDMPEYRKIADIEKAGEPSNPPPKVQANPMSYTSAFVTSIGTNITILPKQN